MTDVCIVMTIATSVQHAAPISYPHVVCSTPSRLALAMNELYYTHQSQHSCLYGVAGCSWLVERQVL